MDCDIFVKTRVRRLEVREKSNDVNATELQGVVTFDLKPLRHVALHNFLDCVGDCRIGLCDLTMTEGLS